MDTNAAKRVLEHALDAKVRLGDAPSGSPDPSIDAWMDLSIGKNGWHLAVECKASAGRAMGRIRAQQDRVKSRWPHVVPLLVVPRLSRKERGALREAGVNHLDMNGNVWIRSAGLVVEREGRRESRRPTPRKSERNPFSKKASFVARAVLAHPSRAWRVREISDEGSLSVGYASEVLQSLTSRGYVEESRDGCRLVDAVSLLSDWSAAYRWEDNEIHSFVAPYGKDELVERAWRVLRSSGSSCLLTLLAALDRLLRYVEHDQVHIYVDPLADKALEALRARLHAEPVPQGGNLHLLVPYYRKAAWYAAYQNAVATVSDVQLFLDLVHYPVRGPEAAWKLLRQRLGPQLGLSQSQIKSLGERVGL